MDDGDDDDADADADDDDDTMLSFTLLTRYWTANGRW